MHIPRSAALLVVLVPLVLVQEAEAQKPTSTTTQSATVAGIRDCVLLQLTVSRTQDSAGNVRSWLTYSALHCAAGSQDPTVPTFKGSQLIPETDYQIGRSSEHLSTATPDGRVDITWTVTDEVHQTYSAVWENTTRGQTVKDQQQSDTKSATPIGVVAGIDVGGRSGYVVSASGQQSTR